MELLFLSLSLVLLLVTIARTILALKHRAGDNDTIRLPPGSLGWPILGETIEFLNGNPEKFIGDRMKKYSPHIFKTKILGENTVVFCGPNGNKFLFANEQKLTTVFRPHSMQKLFRSYQAALPAAQFTREAESKILKSPGFLKPEALVRYLGTMDSMAQQHLQAYWDGKDEVKVFPLSKIFTLTLACRLFLGTDDPGRIAKLVAYFDDITLGMHSIPFNFPGTVFYRANKAAAAIRKELQMIIKEKKATMARGENPQGILSYMILMNDPTGRFMPEVEIAGKMMGLLVAGYSTVATAIAFLMKYVGERPDIYHKIRAEQLEIAASKKTGELLNWNDTQMMKYSWHVVCEVMRLTPPLQGTFREAITDFTYSGFTIPKGWKIYWTVSTTNKNSEYFPEPETFDPSRYDGGNGAAPYSFVPFGGGPRMCPGKEYARLAILSFLHNAAKKFKWEPLLPDEKIMGDMIPSPQHGLPVSLQAL